MGLFYQFCSQFWGFLTALKNGVSSPGNDESEATMFSELAYGKEVYDSDYDVVKRQGFPNGYMAKNDGEEFLPVASEGFFHPSARDKGFLYGSDRGENADKVRQWVSGLWVSLGNQKQR